MVQCTYQKLAYSERPSELSTRIGTPGPRVSVYMLVHKMAVIYECARQKQFVMWSTLQLRAFRRTIITSQIARRQYSVN